MRVYHVSLEHCSQSTVGSGILRRRVALNWYQEPILLVFITKSDCYRVIKFLDAIVFSEITFEMFSHDVTAAILVSQSNETAVTLLSQTNSVVVEHFSVLCKHFLLYKFEYVYFSSFSFWLLL